MDSITQAILTVARLLQVGGGSEWSTLMEAAKYLGVPLTLAIAVLIAGARKKWYFGATVDERIAEIKAQYEARLKDKDEEIAALRAAQKADAQTAIEGLRLTREVKITLERVAREINAKFKRGEGGER